MAPQDFFAEASPGLLSPRLCAALFADAPVIHYAAALSPGAPILFASGHAAAFTGAGAAPMPGRRWVDLIHGEDRRDYALALRRLRREASARIEYRLQAADGLVWVRDSLRRIDGEGPGGGPAVVGTAIDISAEKLAREQSQDALGMLSAIIRSALDAVVTIGEDGSILDFNPEAERMFGYRRGEAEGRPLVELFVPPGDLDAHAAHASGFLAAGVSGLANRRIQLRAQRKDGSTFPVELTVVRTVLGHRPVFVGEIRDMSQRLEAEAERDRSVRLLRDAIDNLPAGFTITGPDDRIVMCNEAYARSMGKPVEALIGRRRTELILKAMKFLRSVDGQPFDGTAEDIARVTGRLCHPSERPIELETLSGETMMIGSSRLADGSIVCVRTDVTEIRRAERTVRESAEVIRRVLDSCPVAIMMTRAEDGQIIYESPASRVLYGRLPGDGPAYATDTFSHPPDRDRFLQALRAKGAVDGIRIQMRRCDGIRFAASVSARLVEFHGEQMIVGTSIDLTERELVEARMAEQREALHQGEKLAALGELLAGVAHELNNPLSVVVGQSLLLRETIDEPAVIERLDRIGRAADRCVRIVKTFLSMARRRPRRSERVDVNALVRDAVEVAGDALRSSGVRVQLRLASSMPAIDADPDQLAQVLTNLVFNAEMALREAGEDRQLIIATEAREEGRQVAIIVRDTGPGIPEELRRRVFEPFFTTRGVGGGTGIGLAFCHRVVDAHGGGIRLDHAPGGGAMFTVVLPVTASDAVGPGSDDDLPPPSPGRRVLVIDDDGDVADVLAAMLRQQGDLVEIALSGREALGRLRRAAYDVVLSDLRMPGLDGERLFRLLSKERPDLVPRLGFITGDAMGAKAQRFLAGSGRPYLEKPIMPAELSRLVAAVAGGSGFAGH